MPDCAERSEAHFLWNRGEASKPNEFEWVSSIVDVAIMAVAISRVLIHREYGMFVFPQSSLARSLAHLCMMSSSSIFMLAAGVMNGVGLVLAISAAWLPKEGIDAL